eukprot:CAMPEP_0197574806 /NCGR_PEP_ID=MMETSP1326-20131121/415_1 /TAXON_ID=1155430 /ORGANISM="Genus nov. species nov., Strain RCC2288" /LENGTH=64 /DNA_ID=CAMNT_0043137449 /DNA_START=201 /DNA_END=392 /DNA_ORIENTATION=+
MTNSALYLLQPCTKDAPRSRVMAGSPYSGRAGSVSDRMRPPTRSRASSTVVEGCTGTQIESSKV